MRRLAGIVALLLLFSGAAPVLACVTATAMSHEESACCRAMHGNCGDMARMGCCRTEVRTDNSPQIPTAAPSFDLHWVVIHWVSPIAAPHSFSAASLAASIGHSPPEPPAASIAILRI